MILTKNNHDRGSGTIKKTEQEAHIIKNEERTYKSSHPEYSLKNK